MPLRLSIGQIAALLTLALGPLSAARAQPCALRWDPTFANPGIIGTVRAMKTYNSGDGARLYAAGNFTRVGGLSTNRIASWNGSTWATLGNGITGTGSAEVFALSVWNGRLYVGGIFFTAGRTGGLASWNGSTWAYVGGAISSTVFALDGTDAASPVGPALYAGGSFNNAGTTANVNGIAKWDGLTWSRLGGGVQAIDGSVGSVNAVLVNNGFVYAGGAITNAFNGPGQTNPIAINHLGRWNGSSWSALAGGMSGVSQPVVYALGIYNGDIIAGGSFTIAGGVSANYIARWNGSAWSALGTGMSGIHTTLRNVRALTVWDDGQGGGPALYAGGMFQQAGGNTVNQIARWDGTTWSALNSGANAAVLAITPFAGGQDALYAGGFFTSTGQRVAERVARWWCITLNPEACCFPRDSSCRDLDFNDCETLGGVAQGPGTDCSTFMPPCAEPLQACCLPNGSCRDAAPSIGIDNCISLGGVALGAGTVCSSSICTGACCRSDGSCLTASNEAWCLGQNGQFHGRGTFCQASPCLLPCCLPDGSCSLLSQPDCANTVRGFRLSPGQTCASDCAGEACIGVIRGDFTGDGLVRGDDIRGFTAQMRSPGPPVSTGFCRATLARGDIPEILNAFDVTAFANCLLTGGPCP